MVWYDSRLLGNGDGLPFVCVLIPQGNLRHNAENCRAPPCRVLELEPVLLSFWRCFALGLAILLVFFYFRMDRGKVFPAAAALMGR